MHLGLLMGILVLLSEQVAVAYQVQPPPLDTAWTYEVGTNPWPEYPRPLLQRSQWRSLNGVWKWGPASGAEAMQPPRNQTFGQDVLVPSCIESGLSGVQQLDVRSSWFTRTFSVPAEWAGSHKRVLLNFEAIDYEATIYVNGQNATFHRGGYVRTTPRLLMASSLPPSHKHGSRQITTSWPHPSLRGLSFRGPLTHVRFHR